MNQCAESDGLIRHRGAGHCSRAVPGADGAVVPAVLISPRRGHWARTAVICAAAGPTHRGKCGLAGMTPQDSYLGSVPDRV
jgi:hypothetical protein